MKKQFIISCLLLFSLVSTVQAQAQDQFLGEIRMFAGNFAPRGWALCDGQLLPVSQNTALFSLLGTIYGGDGRTTFALPDLRGRFAMGTGAGPGLTPRSPGEKSGSESHILTAANLPAHAHGIAIPVARIGNTDNPINTYLAGNGIDGFKDFNASEVLENTGATFNSGEVVGGVNSPVNHMPPYVTVRYIISLTGTYPFRD